MFYINVLYYRERERERERIERKLSIRCIRATNVLCHRTVFSVVQKKRQRILNISVTS